jgi:alkylation response protein AidB-like acyl-CoA dehydrogenase
MADFFADNADLRWYLETGVDWQRLYDEVCVLDDEPAFEDLAEVKEFWTDILGLIGSFAGDEIAPHGHEIDEQEFVIEDGDVVFPPRLQAIFDGIAQLELHGMCVPRQLGGMNCPMLLYFLGAELFARADVSVMTHHSFHGGIAMAMLIYSVLEGTTEFDPESKSLTSTRFAEEIATILRGEAWGCMDITEPDAGSDMGAIRSVGVQRDGQWFASGQKVFITSGSGRYHFVIARTEEAGDPDDPMAGLGGLSLFLVEAYRPTDDGKEWFATVERLEEKIGHHGSPTVAISFDESPAKLVGQRGEGFKLMLLLMNNARIAVGFESLGLCEAAWRAAKSYAAQRPSMGKTIDRHEMIADYLDAMEVDIVGLRALAVRAGVNEELAQRTRLRRDHLAAEGSDEWKALDAESRRRTWTSRLTTPLLKYLAAEKAVEISRTALQIHGGSGYTREYPAEKYLRDALVLPIYEGTSQIQALMATKDSLLAIVKDPGAFARAWADARTRATMNGDSLTRRVARLRSLAQAGQVVLVRQVVKGKLAAAPIAAWGKALGTWDVKADFAPALLHAEHLTKLLAHAAIAEALLEQTELDPARRELALRYVERAEPQARHMLDLIKTTGGRILAKLAEPEPAAEAVA